MSLSLHNLIRAKGSRRNKKRVGHGNASGRGTYSTRGQKGQRSRSGGRSGLKVKGMRNLMHNVPKLGGQKPRYSKMAIINIGQLEATYNSGEVIDVKKLIAKNLIKTNKNGIKILGEGKLTKKFTVVANAFSKSAKDAIIKAGGEVKII